MANKSLSTQAVISIALGIPTLLVGVAGLWLMVWQTNRRSCELHDYYSMDKELTTIVAADEERANDLEERLSDYQLEYLSTSSTLVEDVEDASNIEESSDRNRPISTTHETPSDAQHEISDAYPSTNGHSYTQADQTVFGGPPRQHNNSISGAKSPEAQKKEMKGENA